METTIWILKALISLIFLFVGINKIILPKAKLLDKGMKGLMNLDEKQIKTAEVFEVFGALGLVLPSVFNYFPALSTISALFLGFTMIVAGLINFKLKLSIIPNIIILAICVFIAYWEMH